MNANPDDIPTFAELAADPEIAELLTFEPVPRQIPRPNGWTPEKQREFIAYLAWFGSPKLATDSMGKNVSGVTPLYKQKGSDSFRAAWDGALALHASRQPPDGSTAFLGQIPGMNLRRRENRLPQSSPVRGGGPAQLVEGAPGEVLNEYGEPEDADSFHRRTDEARDSIANKLLRIRRLYLKEISASPGKRAAFEILTELPIDWDLAARCEPQPDEPWRSSNQREPDMILLAESGWSFGEAGYGPDKKAEARAAIDDDRAKAGKPPIDWSTESSFSPPLDGEGDRVG